MYMGDNDGKIMSSEDTGTDRYGNFVGWIGVPRDINGNQLSNTQTAPVTDEDEIRGIEREIVGHVKLRPEFEFLRTVSGIDTGADDHVGGGRHWTLRKSGQLFVILQMCQVRTHLQ